MKQTEEDDNEKVSLLIFYCYFRVIMVRRMLNNAKKNPCNKYQLIIVE